MAGGRPSLVPFTRALNRGGRAIERAGIPIVRIDADALLAEARSRARLDDFGDETFREPFARVIDSLEHEAELSLIGRIAARQDMIRLLSNRLRLVNDQKAHPEIVARPVVRPLFVTGLPRTGTTLLHGLLAQDPANRAPLNWETMAPSPPPDRATYHTDRRIQQAERYLRWFHRLNPDIRRIHPVGARLPEECLIITSHSFFSFQFQTMYHVPSYETWLEAQDLRTCYAWHRRVLQQLQRRCPGRWVLKAPAHLFGLEALFAVYPDAGVIFTHREPLEVAASLASLTAVLRSTFSDGVDRAAVGPEMSARWADAMSRATAARDGGVAPAERFYDVRYLDLVRDPIATVRGIYAHFDLPFRPAAEEAMGRWLAEHRKDRHGRHEYTLQEFGLDAERERERYRRYRERFLA
jgi:hypothetical protein